MATGRCLRSLWGYGSPRDGPEMCSLPLCRYVSPGALLARRVQSYGIAPQRAGKNRAALCLDRAVVSAG
jgi:hypothetical protein